jgi:hypothetical protein
MYDVCLLDLPARRIKSTFSKSLSASPCFKAIQNKISTELCQPTTLCPSREEVQTACVREDLAGLIDSGFGMGGSRIYRRG